MNSSSFFEYIQTLLTLSKEAISTLKDIIVIKDVMAKEHLLELNQINDYIIFINSGILRTYAINDKDKQVNQHLNSSNEFVVSIDSILNKTPSSLAIQALTDSSIVKIPYQTFLELSLTNKEIGELHVKVLENICLNVEDRIFNQLANDARERYLELRKKYKLIDVLIPQHHIASYLGITPIQLSRIRKKMLEE